MSKGKAIGYCILFVILLVVGCFFWFGNPFAGDTTTLSDHIGKGELDAVKKLVTKAKIDDPLLDEDGKPTIGTTALGRAVQTGQGPIVEWLLTLGPSMEKAKIKLGTNMVDPVSFVEKKITDMKAAKAKPEDIEKWENIKKMLNKS